MVFASFGGKIIWQQLVCNSSLTKGRRSVVMPSIWKCFCLFFHCSALSSSLSWENVRCAKIFLIQVLQLQCSTTYDDLVSKLGRLRRGWRLGVTLPHCFSHKGLSCRLTTSAKSDCVVVAGLRPVCFWCFYVRFFSRSIYVFSPLLFLWTRVSIINVNEYK